MKVHGTLGVAALVVSLGSCRGSSPHSQPSTVEQSPTTPAAEVPKRAEFRLFAFGRVLGTIAPCGCTTEPLGGLQYAFGYLGSAPGDQAKLVVEPGSFLFPQPGTPDWPADEAAWVQARDRAKALQTRFVGLGDALVSGIGPTDLAAPEGTGSLESFAMPRVVANVAERTPHKLVKLHSGALSWTVGVTAVVDPELEGADNIEDKLGALGDPQEALRREVTAMREAGAQTTVVLAHGGRPFALSLARAVEGIDFVVVGRVDGLERARLGSPMARVGGAFILEPGEQLQTVSEVRLSIDPQLGKVPEAAQWKILPPKSATAEELARVTERLAKFRADPAADPQFVKRLESERARLEQAMKGAVSGQAVAIFEQVKITCKLPADPNATQLLSAYDSTVAKDNKERFAGVKPPPPKRGTSGFAGIEACSDCHDEAVEFWKTTVHAKAYETLVVDNKQFDLSCVGCHVTGFRQPGGSEVVENEGLRDVQCEVCHGPGERHIEDGGENLKLIVRDTTAELCATQCHTPEHSDTFDYEPYLRDILGPGHGEEARKRLGEGPTGAELRAAGLAKAGGPCKKM
jgi:hypothetical protein